MIQKQRRLKNIALLLIVAIMAYITFFPGRESLNKDITDKFFPNININRLFKVKDDTSKKYLFIKNSKTVQIYELNETASKIKNERIIPFESYWFTVKDQGIDTYLVLFNKTKKIEIKLFDNDIKSLVKELESSTAF